ncbi:hypothetical protein [Nocardiopsis alba]|uniref:hypothetical protein n=1 Tax=Nocardiopsis alba TaxID=53437 RepID=UPI003D707086
MTDDRVNGLSLLVTDLVYGLVADGRMTPDEADMWERHAEAIVCADPGKVAA